LAEPAHEINEKIFQEFIHAVSETEWCSIAPSPRRAPGPSPIFNTLKGLEIHPSERTHDPLDGRSWALKVVGEI
jgi:hypothetical protein